MLPVRVGEDARAAARLKVHKVAQELGGLQRLQALTVQGIQLLAYDGAHRQRTVNRPCALPRQTGQAALKLVPACAAGGAPMRTAWWPTLVKGASRRVN